MQINNEVKKKFLKKISFKMTKVGPELDFKNDIKLVLPISISFK